MDVLYLCIPVGKQQADRHMYALRRPESEYVNTPWGLPYTHGYISVNTANLLVSIVKVSGTGSADVNAPFNAMAYGM